MAKRWQVRKIIYFLRFWIILYTGCECLCNLDILQASYFSVSNTEPLFSRQPEVSEAPLDPVALKFVFLNFSWKKNLSNFKRNKTRMPSDERIFLDQFQWQETLGWESCEVISLSFGSLIYCYHQWYSGYRQTSYCRWFSWARETVLITLGKEEN